MTTPDERRRNLICGREMLEEFSRDAGLQANWRAEAAELLARYPSADFLIRFDADDLSQLPMFADTLTGVRSLFQQMRASETCSAQRRSSLHVVLRHFY